MKPTIYRLHEQADQSGDQPSGILVRTAVKPAAIVATVRRAIWSVDQNQPVWHVQTLGEIVDRQLSTPTQSTALMSAFTLLALVLASLGIYGVLSYAGNTAHQRNRRARGVREQYRSGYCWPPINADERRLRAERQVSICPANSMDITLA